MKVQRKTIPTEKILAAFIVIFNCLAILMLFDFNSFLETILLVDMILLIVYRAEKSVANAVMYKYGRLSEKK